MINIAKITPHYYPVVRGNAVTVRRIEKHVEKNGCKVRLYSLDAMSAADILAGIANSPPDILHAYHGYLGGRLAQYAAAALKVPYIITLTGTDVYEALDDNRREETLLALTGAARLAVFDSSVKDRLSQHLPALAQKTTVIPQGVEIPTDGCHGSGGFPFSPGKFTFLLPAGLRPVKNVLFPLEPLRELASSHPMLRFLLAGPVLDPLFAAEVMQRLEAYPFAHYLGGVSHDAISFLYKKSAVVLNTSLFEGGMANSVLEALACGKPVLAADIAGNRSLISDGVTGLLYRDKEEFLRKAEDLLIHAELREHLGKNGRRLVREHFPPEKEAAAYLELYRAVLGS
jgi:glycosyltransferase involved in cell wall biosynthesis